MRNRKRSRGSTAKRFFISFDDSRPMGRQQKTQLNPPIQRTRLVNAPSIAHDIPHQDFESTNDQSSQYSGSTGSSHGYITSSEGSSQFTDIEEPVSGFGDEPELPMKRVQQYIAELRLEPLPPTAEYHYHTNQGENDGPKKDFTDNRSTAQRDNWSRTLPEYLRSHIEIQFHTEIQCSYSDCIDDGLWRCMDCDTGKSF